MMDPDTNTPTSVENDEEELAGIIAEIQDQVNDGQPLDLEPYLSRFPRFAADLKSFFKCGDFLEEALLPSSVPGLDQGPDDPSRLDLATFPIHKRLADEPLGTVYLMHPAPGHGPRELIVLRSWLKQTEKEAIERHALFSAAFQIPGLLRIVDTGRLNQVPFLVREHAAGPALSDLLILTEQFGGKDDLAAVFQRQHVESGAVQEFTSPPSPRDEVLRELARDKRHLKVLAALFAKWAQILQDLHLAGGLHGELNPSRLVFNAEGSAMVQGTGLAWLRTGIDPRNIRRLEPEWLAPEVRRSHVMPVTWRADVYGLALCFAYALTLERPRLDDLDQAPSSDFSPAARQLLDLVPKSVGRDLRQVLERALLRDPRQRLSSMAEFSESVLAAVSGAKELLGMGLLSVARVTTRRGNVRSRRWGPFGLAVF